MIFVTVGSQMPFDRLITAVDEWAQRSPGHEILAQVGNSAFRSPRMRSVATLSPSEYFDIVHQARLIVGHAGMGTILTAMEFGKPLIVMPRLGHFRETRNDHQVATANWLRGKDGIMIAMREDELGAAIEALLAMSMPSECISKFAPPMLIDALRSFIHAPLA